MIELKDLKHQIEMNKLKYPVIIFKCHKESMYIPHQYANKYCEDNNCEINHIEEIADIPKNNLFSNVNDSLNILKCENLSDELPMNTNNLWVICNKITKKISNKYDDILVDIPKLEDWQIKDFIKSYCDGLEDKYVGELFKYYHNDLFRLENEILKINLVGVKNYDKIKNQLFVDETSYNIFDIVNAIIQRNKIKLSNIYNDIDMLDVDVFGLTQLLINNFKNVIDVQLGRNATAESTGLSGKQFWAVKNYSCGFYSKQELVYIYEFLNDIDYEIKVGRLDTNIAVDYIICKIITL